MSKSKYSNALIVGLVLILFSSTSCQTYYCSKVKAIDVTKELNNVRTGKEYSRDILDLGYIDSAYVDTLVSLNVLPEDNHFRGGRLKGIEMKTGTTVVLSKKYKSIEQVLKKEESFLWDFFSKKYERLDFEAGDCLSVLVTKENDRALVNVMFNQGQFKGYLIELVNPDEIEIKLIYTTFIN